MSDPLKRGQGVQTFDLLLDFINGTYNKWKWQFNKERGEHNERGAKWGLLDSIGWLRRDGRHAAGERKLLSFIDNLIGLVSPGKTSRGPRETFEKSAICLFLFTSHNWQWYRRLREYAFYGTARNLLKCSRNRPRNTICNKNSPPTFLTKGGTIWRHSSPDFHYWKMAFG